MGPVEVWSRIYDRHTLYMSFMMMSVRNGQSHIRNEKMEVYLKGRGEEWGREDILCALCSYTYKLHDHVLSHDRRTCDD